MVGICFEYLIGDRLCHALDLAAFWKCGLIEKLILWVCLQCRIIVLMIYKRHNNFMADGVIHIIHANTLNSQLFFFAPQIESYCAMSLPKPICQKFLFRLVHLVRLTISPRKLWPRLIIVHLRTWCVWHAPKASIQVGLAGNQVAWPN